MRNLKKILALVLALMMVLSVMVTASATSYADDADIEHKEAVEVMSAIGVLAGTGDNFEPNGTLLREQAAKIIAYILEGGELDATVVSAIANPFTDVSGWAVDVIKYCYNEGIILGVGDNKFEPKSELTGYQFAKMLLVAIGICDNDDFVNADWKVVTAAEAKDNGLLAGLTDVVLSAPLSREHAAQMALNAMKVGTTTVLADAYYAVGTVKFASAAEAYFYAQAQTPVASVTYVPAVTTSDALLSSVFGISWVDEYAGSDAYGRPANEYWDAATGGLLYASCYTADPVLTYTSATTEGKIWSALGYSAAAQRITLNYYFNSSTIGGSNTVTKGDVTPVGAQGTLVEVYQTAPYTYTVVSVDTYALKLSTSNIVAAVPATATTDGIPAYVWIDLDSDNTVDAGETWITSEFVKDQVVLYTVADGALTSVSAAEYVVGDVTATAAAYLRVDGNIKYLAANNGGSIGSGAYALGASGYTYYVDTYGNIIMAVAGVPVTVTPNYVYVIATAAVGKTTGAGDNLFESTEASAAAAQAKVIDLTTGEVKIVNIAIAKYGSDYYYLDSTGALTANKVGTYDISGLTGLRAYTELEDGSIVIGSTASTSSVTVQKGVATVATGKYANSSTVLTVVEYAVDAYGNYSATVTTTTGIANFPVSGATYDAIVTAAPTTGVVSNLLVVKPASAPVDTVDYAVYAETGETTTISGTSFTQLFYYVGGEKVGYYAPTALVGTAVAASAGVYDITLTSGVLTATAPVSAINSSLMTVVAVDDTYVLLKSAGAQEYTVYYALTGCEIYNADNYYAADVLEADDTVWVYGATRNGNVWTGANLIVIDN